MKKFLQLFGLGILYLICAVLLSTGYGLLAKGLYQGLKASLKLEQIKIVIDILSTAITILVMPFFIYAFWKIVKSLNKMSGRTYLLLLAELIAFYSLGMVYVIISHVTAMDKNPNVIKGIIALVLIIANFYVTREICIKGGKVS